jgi:hypothetical protein
MSLLFSPFPPPSHRNLAARDTIMATAKHERNDFCHGEQLATHPGYLSGVGRAACD